MQDLAAQIRPLRGELHRAIQRVLDSGRFALGPEVEAFEAEFARFVGVEHCVGVASGSSALELALRALGLGPEDEVLLPGMTFVAGAFAVLHAGARPVFVDVDPERLTLDPECLARALGPRSRVVLAVHLFGRPAAGAAIRDLADRRGLALLEDAAQAAGAGEAGGRAGSSGLAGCFSFYPTKNLGALGEAGAVTTDSAELAGAVRELRNQGRTSEGHERVGLNARMDALQAAALRVQLPHLEAWNRRRRAIAAAYDKLLADLPLGTPPPQDGHVYHQYVIRHPQRDDLRQALARRGIESALHYARPVHLEAPFRERGWKPGDLPAAEAACRSCLSLPIHPALADDQVEEVAAALRDAIRELALRS